MWLGLIEELEDEEDDDEDEDDEESLFGVRLRGATQSAEQREGIEREA